MLGSGAVGAAAVASGALPALLSPTWASASSAASFAGSDRDLHLLRRATWGPNRAALARIEKVGANRWLDEQLDPRSIRDAACEDLIDERFPRLRWSIRKAWKTLDFGWDLMFDLGVSTLARACWSERQLLEVMVDFWSNHLNVANPSDSVWASRHDYDRRVIREHALGRFSDMLRASATHPAMMTYLNNAESTKESPNENYGRELLELHTVGVDGGYDETDMRNSALVMTGFGIDWDTGEFEYHDWAHWTGPVRVMNWSAANRDAKGKDLGLDYVDFLAHHPSTAQHLATKLAIRFVSDTPDRGLVDALAQTYLDHGTAIVPVLEKLFRSTSFANAIGEKVRRPMQDLVGTVRTLGIRPDASGKKGMYGLYWMLEGLGDAPMAWPQPNGYPDFADAWRSAGGLLARWNMHQSLASHWWPKALRLPELRKLLPKRLPATHGDAIDVLSKKLVFQTMRPGDRDAILGLIGKRASDPLSADDELVDWRLESVVALILHTPYHEVR